MIAFHRSARRRVEHVTILREAGMDGISRRTLFAGVGLAAAASGEGQAKGSRKLKVIVAGGHPGDPEYGCGGTVARYTELGHEVVLLYLNRGDSGYLEKPVEDASAVDRKSTRLNSSH